MRGGDVNECGDAEVKRDQGASHFFEHGFVQFDTHLVKEWLSAKNKRERACNCQDVEKGFRHIRSLITAQYIMRLLGPVILLSVGAISFCMTLNHQLPQHGLGADVAK